MRGGIDLIRLSREAFRHVKEWKELDWRPESPHDHRFQLGLWARPDTGTDMVTVRCTGCGAAMLIATSLPKSYDLNEESPDETPEEDARHLAYRICVTWGYLCGVAERDILLQEVQGS